MSTLSLHENSQQAARADRLCRIIESHADVLRSADAPRRFSRDGVSFRLFRADRNTIYRLDDGMQWFLKMPRSGNPVPIEHEILGGMAVRDATADFPGYYHPDVVQASASHAYLLTARIPGRMLNWGLLRVVVMPFARLDTPLRETFSRLGTVIAKFHQSPVRDELPTTRPIADVIHKALKQATRRDKTRELIERHVDRLSAPVNGDCMTHGNLHLQNVLFPGGKLSLIDFENSGRGSAYNDLSLVSAQLMCMGLSVHVSAKRLEACWHALLGAYTSYRSIDHDIPRQTTAARMCDYYLRGFCSGKSRPTALGAPMIRKRVQRVVRALLLGEGRAGQEYVSTA